MRLASLLLASFLGTTLLASGAHATSQLLDGGVSTTGYIQSAGISATNISATRISGDGSGLTNVATGDRIVSGTYSLIMNSTAGTANFTSGANATLNMVGSATGDATVQLGNGRTGNGYAYVDMVGDATFTDYGLRILRDNTGANATSWLQHRGTGAFNLWTTEAAPIIFSTTSLERLRISPAGNVGIGTTAPSSPLHVQGSTGTTNGLARFTTSDMVDASTGSGLLIRTGANTGNTYTTMQALSSGFTANNNLILQPGGGNVGIGTTSPGYALDVASSVRSGGEYISTNANSYRLIGGNYGAFWRNDGASLYLLLTASGDQYGTWNTLRPFTVNLTTGAVTGNITASSAVTATYATNAGTLNNIDSTGFALSNAADTDQYLSFRVVRNAKASTGDGLFLGYGNTNSGVTRIFSAGSTGAYYTSDASGNITRSDGATYWHSANDGAGSGLDADLLDGLNSTAFVQKTGDTMSGNLIVNGNVGISTTAPTQRLDLGGGNISMGWEKIQNTCAAATCVATCSSGKQVTGGGCTVVSVTGGTVAIQNATPSTNTYTCYYSGTWSTINIVASAICANIR